MVSFYRASETLGEKRKIRAVRAGRVSEREREREKKSCLTL